MVLPFTQKQRMVGKTSFDGEALRGTKLTKDLVDAKTGKSVATAGTKMTPRSLKKLEEAGLEEVLVTESDVLGRFFAGDIVNMTTGEVVCEAGDEITEASLARLDEMKVKDIDVLAIDNINVGPHLRNTLAKR